MMMNKNRFIKILIVFMFSAAGCQKDYYLTTPEVDLSVPVSFSKKIQPILTEDCATAGCHVTGIQSPDLTEANSYDQLTQLGYVDTTDAEGSLIYKRLTSSSKPMPPDGKISDLEINYILAWIKQGAQKN
jgi:hypothetical protein